MLCLILLLMQTPDPPFRVTITPTKTSFKVGEPVRFAMWSSLDCYLYVLGQDSATGNWQMLYPKEDEHLQLTAGQTRHFPGDAAPMVSDKEGIEFFSVLASTRPLTLDFARPRDPSTQAEWDLMQLQNLVKGVEGKGDRDQALYLPLKITISNRDPFSLSLDKKTYPVDGLLRATLWTERAGFGYLLLKESGKDWQCLGVHSLLKDQEFHWEMNTKTAGNYQLMVLWRPDRVTCNIIEDALQSQKSKQTGVTLRQSKSSRATAAFRVE